LYFISPNKYIVFAAMRRKRSHQYPVFHYYFFHSAYSPMQFLGSWNWAQSRLADCQKQRWYFRPGGSPAF